MQLPSRRSSWLPCLSLLAACAAPPRGLQPVVSATERTAFAVDLGGWTSQAELVRPTAGGVHGAGPWPTVLLIHGNGPHDMDVTLRGPDGETRMFAAIAEHLAARGFAVVRYHKRWVKAPGRFDARFWREQSTFVFTDDAGKVLDAALALPGADPARLVLYGWSEGTAVAAALAARRGDIDALVLQGVVGLPWREMVRGWILDTGLPYAASAAGPVTADSLGAALRGNGGVVAKLGASFFADPAARQRGEVRVSPLLDRDGDGALDPAQEVRPAIEAMLDFAFGPQGNLYVYAPDRAVPTVTEQAPALHRLPLLVLQGQNDASTPPAGAQRVAAAWRAAGGTDITVLELGDRGHMLGRAAAPVDDLARPIDPGVLDAAAVWLLRVTAAAR
ncbi:MAG: hypothetical protein JNL08_16955 [Planctomycetes bacterium]|nr:hypothetical protein [Planctomycetota bacterium]